VDLRLNIEDQGARTRRRKSRKERGKYSSSFYTIEGHPGPANLIKSQQEYLTNLCLQGMSIASQ
jgi:hypothetical protein